MKIKVKVINEDLIEIEESDRPKLCEVLGCRETDLPAYVYDMYLENETKVGNIKIKFK